MSHRDGSNLKSRGQKVDSRRVSDKHGSGKSGHSDKDDTGKHSTVKKIELKEGLGKESTAKNYENINKNMDRNLRLKEDPNRKLRQFQFL